MIRISSTGIEVYQMVHLKSAPAASAWQSGGTEAVRYVAEKTPVETKAVRDVTDKPQQKQWPSVPERTK